MHVDLGPSEMHVVNAIKAAIKGCKKNAQEIIDDLDMIDIDNFEEAFAAMDSKNRQIVITILDQLGTLSTNLAGARLVTLIGGAMLKHPVGS